MVNMGKRIELTAFARQVECSFGSSYKLTKLFLLAKYIEQAHRASPI